MGKAERAVLIRKIEKINDSRVISYVTSTRENIGASMAMDAPRKVYQHLLNLVPDKQQQNIDLFLHSNGGEATVPWRLVTLIREYAKTFRVLIPHRAFSAATLTAMGADQVIMHPMGMLGPTDPTVANPFNPIDPTNPTRRLGISVEDVTAYLALIKDDADIHGEQLIAQAFQLLAEKVHPLALGNVKRHLSLSRLMARKLLTLHMDASKDEVIINSIVENLTTKLFYHGHPINRREARDQVGLPTVVDASPDLEALMSDLYADYEVEMKMEDPFQPDMEFLTVFPSLPLPATVPGVPPAPIVPSITPVQTITVTAIESLASTDLYTLDYELSGEKQANGAVNVSMITRRQGWVTV